MRAEETEKCLDQPHSVTWTPFYFAALGKKRCFPLGPRSLFHDVSVIIWFLASSTRTRQLASLYIPRNKNLLTQESCGFLVGGGWEVGVRVGGWGGGEWGWRGGEGAEDGRSEVRLPSGFDRPKQQG